MNFKNPPLTILKRHQLRQCRKKTVHQSCLSILFQRLWTGNNIYQTKFDEGMKIIYSNGNTISVRRKVALRRRRSMFCVHSVYFEYSRQLESDC